MTTSSNRILGPHGTGSGGDASRGVEESWEFAALAAAAKKA
jgi:hypothetical protein